MQRKVVHGTRGPLSTCVDSNGFVNRRSSVQSRVPAPSSENAVTTDEVGALSADARGFRAATAAGRKPVAFQQFGPVDRAVMAEIGRYQTQPRKSRADRARLRAVLIPFFHLSGVM